MQSGTGQSTNTSAFGYRKLNTTALKIGNVPKWVPDNEQQVKYAPSAFMYEMGLSTEERTVLQMREATVPKILEFLDMGQTSYQRDSIVDVNRPLFDAQPSEIVFQQFESTTSYDVILSLRNIDKVARSIKLVQEESPYFTIIPPKLGGNKVAPGMVAAYTIRFTPDERKDYHHQLVCITEREKFLIPIRALGPRAVLDFPDELHFPTAPVKYASTKTVLVRNVGNCEGKFDIEITSPFTVEPMEGSLGVGDYMQLNVEFKPKKVGDYKGALTVHYNTGEAVCIKLYGGSCDANVRMDKSSVKLDNTFIGMTSQKSVIIHNRSNVVVHYEWKAFATEEDEQTEKEIRMKTLNVEESLAKEAFTKECFRDPTVRDRMSMLTRAFGGRKKQYVDEEKFIYYDDIIAIEPSEGEIWPNSQAEISVVFTPDEPTSYTRIVYCDVIGRETRLPLRIRGEGLGPKLQFSFDSLNIENVFINSPHAYEVILENKGGIEAMYNITPSSNSLFGPNFSFSPNEGVLHPGGLQAIQISFCSSVLGEFDEVFLLTADGAPEPVKLHISGKVIGPTFQFDVSEIKFGLVSCGFVNTAEVTLCNTSEIPMTYHLRVPSDGSKESLADDNAVPPVSSVREFTIRPRSGTIPPDLSQDIQVDFTPVTVKNYSVVLVVDVEGVGEEVFSLPVTAKSVVPQIGLSSTLLDYGRCFIGCPCTRHVELVNTTALPARYEMQPQAEGEFVAYSSTSPKGVILPNSILKVPIQVEVKRLGEMICTVIFIILGGSETLEVELHFIGEGPVVNFSPTHINWSRCPVLTPIKRIVTLSNQSVIDAQFECVMTRDRTVFSVEPVSGVVPAEDKLELTVTALLNDCIQFTDKLTVVIFHGVGHTFNLTAEGYGTTIVSQPSLQSLVDLGPHFSSRPCSKQFILTNRGRRKQVLYWVTEGFSIVKMRRAEMANEKTDMLDIGRMHSQKGSGVVATKRPVFQVVPDKLELEPHESKMITIEGHCINPQVAKERLLCYSIIGRNPQKEHIMSVDITTSFISPVLKFSKEELHFSTVLPPGSKLQVLKQNFTTLNVSPLPITAMFTSNYPFLFASDEGPVPRLEVKLNVEEEAKLVVKFDPAYRPDRHSRKHNSSIEVSYKEHPHKDYIPLKSEVHFPNVVFEKVEVDFGCILNDTEHSQYVTMTNTSPLPVHYQWFFIEQPPVVRSDPANEDEGIDVNSTCEMEDESESSEETKQTEEEVVQVETTPTQQSQLGSVSNKSSPQQPPDKLQLSPEGSKDQLKQPSIYLDTSLHQKIIFDASETIPIDQENEHVDVCPVDEPIEQQAQSVYSQDTSSPEKEEEKDDASESSDDNKPQPWELVGDRYAPIRIEQIFDILPLHGILPCGQPQEVQFSFYGHADIACSVIAACKVDGGPTYKLRLSGEASRVEYRFNRTTVDVGPHLYDKVIREVVTLTNLGKVEFKFFTIDVPDSGDLAAGGITVSPASGVLSSLEEQKFTIQYLPGTPEPFSKSFLVQVAHFKPDTITVVGTGVFPSMSLNLPRLYPNDGIEMRMVEQSIVKQFAIENNDMISSVKPAGKTRPRPELPPFLLDFGYVVYGCVEYRSVTLTNVSYPLISFTTAHASLNNTGFSVDIGERVKNLPGAPDCESIDFNVKLDPASVHCPLGKVEARLPFNLVGGPVYWLNLSATVTLPELTMSTSCINFDTVQCGRCKVITIRIRNPYNIKCEWSAVTEKPKKKLPKFTPLHVKKKLKGPEQISCFELYPVSGCLLAGDWINVKVKFMPTEEVNYKQIIPIRIAQNPNSDHQLTLEGVGSEPKIIFSQPLLEFGPVFPFSQGDYQEVTIHNPTSFPIELYSVDFDNQYIEEEEILRWIKGYNKQKFILLPPREAGEKLPVDIINAYECDHSNMKTRSSMLGDTDSTIQAESGLSVTDITPSHSQLQMDKSKKEGDYLSTQTIDIPQSTSLTSSTSLSPPIAVMPAFESTSHLLRRLEQGEDLAELQNSPVCTTLAKYMGVDISPEAKLAEGRRGVVILMYGPVMSGKSTQARLLAETYSGAILTIDNIIIDAISNATSAAGKRARESCIEATISPVDSIPTSNTAPVSDTAPKKSSQKGDKEQAKPEQTLAPEQTTTTALYCESPQPFQVAPAGNNSLNTYNNILMPTRLPEDCVVDILSERLQQADCQKAAIFDGLTSQFVSTQQTLAGLVLKATNNRKYIFFVNLSMTLEEIKQREREIEEEKLRQERLEEEQRLAEEKAKRDEEARLDQLSEDEYEALSEEVKAQIDARMLKAKKEKIRQRWEEQQKLLQQKQAMEEARKEEEGRDKSRRNKRKSKITTVKTEAKVESIKSSRPPSASSIGKQPSLVFRTSALGGLGSTVSLDRPLTPSDSPSEANLAVKPSKKKTRRVSAVLMDDSIVTESTMDKKYRLYEESLVGLTGLMDNWIRALGEVKPKKETEPTSGVEDTPTHVTTKRKSRKETAPIIVDPVPELVVPTTSTGISLTDFDDMEGVGVPVINITANANVGQVFDELYNGGVLPPVEEVLDGMGLGPDGPPIPPPYEFSVVSYPQQRRSRQDIVSNHFEFVASSPDDPNAAVLEDVSKPVSETELPEAPELDTITATSGRTSKKSSLRSTESTDAGSSVKGKPKSTRSQKAISPVPSVLLEEESTRSKSISPALPAKLVKFRWVIPARDQIILKMKFISDEVGQIDQTFTFEIVGTKRKYQLFCRGHAIFPSISREPRLVFAHRKNSIRDGEIVHKKFVLSQDKYIFGPLHCGKTRERYREGRYPDNMEKLNIINTSAIVCNATFCFEHDTNATTFLLEPPGMILQPGQSKELTVWAYPKASKHYEDSVVCCIKYNPEPAVFPISCDGVQPELEVDKKVIQFEKVLLHRKETRSLFLRNNTLLPVQWRLSGLDALGNDFSFNQEHGIVQPKSEFELKIHFRASKANNYKRALKLEISDVEQIVGLMHVETIQVQAEAYDVAMDISFPRGADGGLDFQCIRVGDEAKQSIQLKNKGKYDIEYRIMFDSVDGVDLSKCFTTQPTRGMLYPGEKPQSVTTTFKSEQEITIRDQPMLKCQIIEPHIGESGDVIANIPIRISARAVYSLYSISPVNDINFGAIILNSKKSRSFVIENKGEFEFKYAITKLTQDKQRNNKSKDPRDTRAKSRDGQTSSQLLQKSAGATKAKPDSNLRNEVPTVAQRLVIGMFTLHPAGGQVGVGQSQTINIDCVAESLGKVEEVVAIDISGRSVVKGRSPSHIHYKIYGEVLLPGINYNDIVSIFEEHRICKKLGLISQHHFKEDGSVGVYGEEDKRFVFHSVIVGQTAQAQFKITNPNKIPCDAHIAIKPVAGKGSSKGMAEGFDVEPTKVSIPAHSLIYSTITFRPTAMQLYSGQFEASVDGPPAAKSKMLTFDVQGEGSLPQVTVIRPTIRNNKGLPLLLYKRLLMGQSQILPLVLRNNGNITATVILDVVNGSKSFGVVPPSDEEASPSSLPTKSPLIMDIKVGEEINCNVVFSPSAAKKCKGVLRLSLRNNQFEDTPIQLVGEGYEEEVIIDNIRGQVDWTIDEELLPSDSSEEISAVRENHLQFGDCAVKESRQIIFTLTNHSTTNIYWFQWPTGSHLVIFPRTGHLHPGKSKDITVTFRASQPKCLKNVKAFAKLSQIIYSKPLSQVSDWDDSMRSVKWVTIRQQSRGSEQQAGSPTSGNVLSKPASATERGIADVTSTMEAAVKPPTTPAKRKIEEVDLEPAHSTVEDSQRELELFVSAVADYAKYSTTTTNIKFRDTFMYQTRSYSFSVVNTGKVTIHYQWIMLDDSGGTVTPVGELHLNDAGSIVSEGGDCPVFTFEPSMGKIAVGEEAHFIVKFSPLDVQDMHATFQCVIPNLEESAGPLMVTVQGCAMMPYCHFELEESDYLTSGKRSASQRGPFGAGAGTALEPNTKVIEFHSCGVGVKDTKCFSIINPTSQAYEFFWTNEDGINSHKNPVFKCLTTKGFISGGKKSEVLFECTPNSLELVESFWRFTIPSLSLSTPFLLVSSAVEPAVSMDRAYLKFKAMLLGTECHETVYLVNDESQTYSFSFVETSCYCDGHTAKVKVRPMSGTLQPNSRLAIHVSFVATREREYNFNLQCQVKKKPSPIILNVKAEGFLITYTLQYEDRKGSMTELFTGKGLAKCIDLGKVEVQEKCLKQITLVNNGKYSFEYSWELVDTRGILMTKSPSDSPIMSILPLEGNAEPNQRTVSELTFCPPTKLNLRGTELVLKIKNGPTLPISLAGRGVEPIVELSFNEHDFGPCFLHRAYMPPKQVTLVITNKDKKDISLNCLYVNKPHLEVHTDPGVKSPGKVTEATISFLPRDTIKYCETVWFEVNGLSRVPVVIKGEGTQMKVEVANPAQKVVNFGAVTIGSKTTKLVKVINRSLTSITFTVSIAISSAVLALQQDGILSIAPTSEITLKPNGGTHTIEVTFNPTMRVPSFSEEVMLECSGLSKPLFVVTGSCHGIEITLDTYHIPFGAVVQQSQSTRRILLLNTGDIGAKFTWDVAKFGQDFVITPVEGYISPGMEIPFDITFCPKQVNNDIRYEKVPCAIEGSKKPLLITLTGTCIAQVPLKEVLHFTTTVRSQESRQITLHNRTTTPWLVRPMIDGEYWSGANTISIDPGHPKHYELTYAPLRMTTDTAKHQGSIFFPFPDGNGLLYNLLGTAEAPKQAGSIYQEVPCKTSHTELLRVTNWLRRPQRFRAIVEMIKPDKQDRSITLNGLDYIDVPALGRKDYKLNFYTYKEGSFSAKVTFRNEQTLEYLFYNVHFKATPPGTMATINLTTTVRKNVSHTITIFNPLPSPVTMNTNVTSQDINMPTSFIVGAESEGACMFEYLPLKVVETSAKLVMTSNELGLYQYELRLVANPAPPERTVHFTTTIGNSLQQVCKFISFAKARTEYICKVDNAAFNVERNLTVASAGSSGTEATVEVTFEPCYLGDTKGNLSITSQTGGDYTIPLIGHCLVPKPQGPYTIKAGLNITIPFKNVFPQPTHFTFTVDNPVFSVKATELLKPKKVCNLLVSYDKQADPQLTKTGKLVVTCPPGTPGVTAGLQWIYYLKGIVPQN